MPLDARTWDPWLLKKTERWFDRRLPTRYDIVHVLRGQALAVALLGRPELSAYAIETAMGWRRKRPEKGLEQGTYDSNAIARAINGMHPLSSKRLDTLQGPLPDPVPFIATRLVPKHYAKRPLYYLAFIRELPLWLLVAGCKLEETFPTLKSAFLLLNNDTFWTVYYGAAFLQNPEAGLVRPGITTDTNALTRLAARGTLDGVTALCMIAYFAQSSGDRDGSLCVARYIPVALAMYGTHSLRALRLAVLLFTQLRRCFLDNIHAGEDRLHLHAYDLPAASQAVKALGDECRDYHLATYRRDAKVEIHADLEAWVTRSLPPLCNHACATHDVIWAPGMGPHYWLSALDRVLGPLHAKALSVIHAAYTGGAEGKQQYRRTAKNRDVKPCASSSENYWGGPEDARPFTVKKASRRKVSRPKRRRQI